MSKDYVYHASDEVETALKKKAAKDDITDDALFQKQMDYYISCALYDDFDPNTPINTPKLSIRERLEVYAEGTNNGIEAARAKVTAILASR